MEYVISFIEGIVTFVSPCLLPMLPVYISYFSGGKGNALKNAIGFVLGFTIVFVALGAFAGSIGGLLRSYGRLVDIVCGGVIIFFGLSMLDVVKLNWFKGINKQVNTDSFGSAVFLGMVFSVSWTPCVGAFLGSALLLASSQGSALKGVLMLLCYSVGLGLPFIISAVLIDRMKRAFDFIKAHYKAVNTASGILLILMGVLMATGLLTRLLTIINAGVI